MTTQAPIDISAEVTPNPNTLKFNVNRTLVESGSLNFPDAATAKGSKFAEALFAVRDVLGVMVGRSFVTVTKNPAAQWPTIVPDLMQALKTALASAEPLFAAGAPRAESAEGGGDIEARIRQILDTEIRPAVAMDGGDILFYGYRDGVVTLHLQGSCSHCPSSIMTLKMGVETRLKQAIPEVREVVQV